MAHRKMSADERCIATLMIDSKLECGEPPASVVSHISMWLRVAHNWTGQNAADRRARELVEVRKPIVERRKIEGAERRACEAAERTVQMRLGEAAAQLRALGFESASTHSFPRLSLDAHDAERLTRLARFALVTGD